MRCCQSHRYFLDVFDDKILDNRPPRNGRHAVRARLLKCVCARRSFGYTNGKDREESTRLSLDFVDDKVWKKCPRKDVGARPQVCTQYAQVG